MKRPNLTHLTQGEPPINTIEKLTTFVPELINRTIQASGTYNECTVSKMIVDKTLSDLGVNIIKMLQHVELLHDYFPENVNDKNEIKKLLTEISKAT